MTTNFNPATVVTDIADLCQRVAALETAIKNGSYFAAAGDASGALDDVNKILEEFVPRLNNLETAISPIIPVIPKLLEMLSGEVAGVGATQVEAEALGTYTKDETTKA